MMEALAELRKDMDTLKEKSLATEVAASAEASASACVNSQAPAVLSSAGFSGFSPAEKDIIKAATIMTKSLMVLDKIAQDSNPDVAHEVGMINGALAL